MTEVLKRNGQREIFSEEKFTQGLQRAGFESNEIEAALIEVKKHLYDGIPTDDIYKKAHEILRNSENPLPVVRYSLKRSVLELGPTGFPFEKFVARIFEEKGYKTQTGVMLKGHCIDHEIDVLAYKDDELILMETKFHNEPSLKSDTKVALYVKARYEDLQGMEFDIDGKKMKMTKALLITNTAFTENSINYVECHRVYDLISWTYPRHGNLLDLIEEVEAHPITCIPTLSSKEKERLIENGYIYCKDVLGKPEALEKSGVKKSKIDEAMNTIELVCKEHRHNS